MNIITKYAHAHAHAWPRNPRAFKRNCNRLYLMASFSRELKVIDTTIEYAVARVGLKELKPEQREVVHSFASGKDVVVALPSGYGRSYCFALLPFVFDFLQAASKLKQALDANVPGPPRYA